MEREDPKKPIADKPVERVVLPPAATKRFKEILEEGGIITKITLHFRVPLRGYHGESYLFDKEVEGIEIK